MDSIFKDAVMDTTFKYTVKADGSVDYISNYDNKVQNLSGRDISSKEALEADLANYTTAYLAGLQTAEVTVGTDLKIGKQASADASEV